MIKHLFDPVIKALTEVREVQEKVMALESSRSFCGTSGKCVLLPAQPNLSGVGEKTSLSLQPFAPSAHSSLGCHLPGCLCRSGKSEGTCQAPSATHCAQDKGKVVVMAGSSAEIWRAGLIQLPHILHHDLSSSREVWGQGGDILPLQAGGGIRCLGHACFVPAQVKLVVSLPLTTSPAAVLGSCLLHLRLQLMSSNEQWKQTGLQGEPFHIIFTMWITNKGIRVRIHKPSSRYWSCRIKHSHIQIQCASEQNQCGTRGETGLTRSDP